MKVPCDYCGKAGELGETLERRTVTRHRVGLEPETVTVWACVDTRACDGRWDEKNPPADEPVNDY